MIRQHCLLFARSNSMLGRKWELRLERPRPNEVHTMRHAQLLALLILPVPVFAQSADEKNATIRFLTALQQRDGGFIAEPPDRRVDVTPQSSLRATSGAMRAIRYLGGEVPNKDKALAFVKSCLNADTGS